MSGGPRFASLHYDHRMQLSQGVRTDLEILALDGSILDDRGDHIVVHSPSNPGYHWGNFVQVTTGDVEDADRWLKIFEREFPEAGWIAIGLPAMPHTDAYAKAGCDLEEQDSLLSPHLPELRPLCEGYHVRPLGDHADWAQLVEAEVREWPKHRAAELAGYRAFKVQQVEARRRMQRAGHLGWWGAFDDGGELCASLGLVTLGEVGRYQSVLTHEHHRRRGLAGHLLGLAARWGEQHGALRFVIVTERTNQAGKLYRSLGFEPEVPGVEVYRAPVARVEELAP